MTNSTFTFAIVAFILWAISATLLRFLKNEPILLKILGAIPGACGAILAILGVFQALPAPTIALLPCGKRDGCAILMLDCRVSFLDLYYTLSSPSSGSEWTRYDPDAPPHLEPGQPVHTYSQFLFFQSQIVYGGTVPPDPSPSPPDFPSPSPTLTPNPTPKPTPKPPPTPEPSPEPTPVLLQKLTLSPDRTDLFPGESLALTVTGSPPEVPLPPLVWRSENPSVAQVDQNGRVTAVDPGQAVITVSAGDLEASMLLWVTSPSFYLSDDELELTVGDQVRLKLYSSNYFPDGLEVYWNSTDSQVALVDQNGWVTALSEGSCRIKAHANGTIYTCSVEVEDPAPYEPAYPFAYADLDQKYWLCSDELVTLPYELNAIGLDFEEISVSLTFSPHPRIFYECIPPADYIRQTFWEDSFSFTPEEACLVPDVEYTCTMTFYIDGEPFDWYECLIQVV